MGKIAFIYPGQGAQKTGMGEDFYSRSECAAEVFNTAERVLDFDVKKLCFEENELLDLTEYTQPAMVTACLAMTAEILRRGIKPDVTAGLSLGEYAAIAAAGGMSYADAIETVRARGLYMSSAVPDGMGTMAAVLGLDEETINACVESIEGVSVANYNCPGQVVITGEKQAVLEAGEKLMEHGARRVAELNVSGPFHSPFLKEAGEKLAAKLDAVNLMPLTIPYVANVNAEFVSDMGYIRELLREQVSSSVRWEQSIRNMIDNGVDTFVEIGPGKTLAGFMKRIDRSVKMINVESYEDVEKLKEQLC